MTTYDVRFYDGFDNEWMDAFNEDYTEDLVDLPRERAEAEWLRLTENGTKSTQYSDIDYYAIFVHGKQGYPVPNPAPVDADTWNASYSRAEE